MAVTMKLMSVPEIQAVKIRRLLKNADCYFSSHASRIEAMLINRRNMTMFVDSVPGVIRIFSHGCIVVVPSGFCAQFTSADWPV